MWFKKPIHWEDNTAHYYSIVFSWQLHKWIKTVQPELDGKKIIVGGPAVKLNPEIIPSFVIIGKDIPTLWRHNIFATKTSTGCIRNCSFCAVPKLEGKLKEIKKWEVKPILIDNNLLACSIKHFDSVIDNLKKLKWCDFNQGLDARILTKYHAGRFAELKNPLIRLAFDHTKNEKQFLKAFELLRNAGINKKNIRVYVLIGFKDTPEDALYRLRLVNNLKIKTSAMRYQPLDTKNRNEYVDKNWTDRQLIDYMKYWNNLRYFAGIPFDEYDYKSRRVGYKTNEYSYSLF